MRKKTKGKIKSIKFSGKMEGIAAENKVEPIEENTVRIIKVLGSYIISTEVIKKMFASCVNLFPNYFEIKQYNFTKQSRFSNKIYTRYTLVWKNCKNVEFNMYSIFMFNSSEKNLYSDVLSYDELLGSKFKLNLFKKKRGCYASQ